MKYKITDPKYHFITLFDDETGAYIRSGIIENGKDTGTDPMNLELEITDILNKYGMIEKADEDIADSVALKDFPNIGFPPEYLSNLSTSLIRLLKEADNYMFPNYDFEKICSALEQNGEDIIADTESADWTYDAEGRGEAGLFLWFWALSTSIAEGAHLNRLPSSAGVLSSFHYDKENGESREEKYSY